MKSRRMISPASAWPHQVFLCSLFQSLWIKFCSWIIQYIYDSSYFDVYRMILFKIHCSQRLSRDSLCFCLLHISAYAILLHLTLIPAQQLMIQSFKLPKYPMWLVTQLCWPCHGPLKCQLFCSGAVLCVFYNVIFLSIIYISLSSFSKSEIRNLWGVLASQVACRRRRYKEAERSVIGWLLNISESTERCGVIIRSCTQRCSLQDAQERTLVLFNWEFFPASFLLFFS